MQIFQHVRNRDDLDALQTSDSDEYAAFMRYLKRSMQVNVNVAQYPDNYGEPDYIGSVVEPVFEVREDLTIIHRFGLSVADLADY